MGRMKEVFQLKQEMIERNSFLENMPDKFFIEIYLKQLKELKQIAKELEDYKLKEQIDDYKSSTALPQDNYNYDPDGEGAPGVN
jgi:hypothetical protein